VRIREQHPATVDRATTRRLPRQSQARGDGQKRRWHLRLQCRPCESGAAASWRVPVRVREEWSLRRRIPSGGRHPGLRESVALRGAAQERGPWSIHEDEGTIQPSGQRVDDESRRGARVAQWGGESSPTSYCGSRRREGRSFARSHSARAVQRCRPTVIAASGGRVEASPASGVATGRWLSVSYFAARLQRRRGGVGRTVAARSSRDPSSRGEGRSSLKRAAVTRAHSRRLRNAALRSKRESDARGCVRASGCSCRSRWAAVWSTEARVDVSRENRETGRCAGTGV